MFDAVVERVLDLPAPAALAVIFALPALEASAFVGVVFPGEIAVLLGGVLASQSSLSFTAVLLAAFAGAVIGDSIGYAVGARFGERLLLRLPDRLLDREKLDRAEGFVRRMGAKGVVLGRWTAALRALVPGLAGMSRMRYPRFLVANVIGAALWAAVFVTAGYVAGDSWPRVQRVVGRVGLLLGGLVLLALVAFLLVRRRRRVLLAAKPLGQPAVPDGDR